MMTGLSGKQFAIVIVLIEAASALMVFALLASQGRPGFGVAVGAGIIVMPFILIPATLKAISSVARWPVLASLYPEVESAPEPKSRRLCSIAIRSAFIGINNCVLADTDEDHLHLRMPAIFDWGMRPLSIPWAAVTEIDSSMLGRVKLTILDGPSLWVPRERLSWRGERRRLL